VLLKQLLDALECHGARSFAPQARADADILVIGTPIWLGQPSSVAKRVLERMDAFLDETDAKGRMPCYGKVALAVIVGNEDGAYLP
jgi:multimeric flavodoxin WrbA